MSTDSGPATDATPLDHVIDDLESKQVWSDWAFDAMVKGRPADEVTAELVINGWSEDDAAEMAETARRQTRHLRGVVTRDEVARANASRYHKATALSWFTPILSIASAWRLLNSLAFLLGSRRPHHAGPSSIEELPGPRAPADAPGEPAATADVEPGQQISSTTGGGPRDDPDRT